MQQTKFQKPALGIPALIGKYKARGLKITDPVRVGHYLKYIGYYRLSGYARFFSDPRDPDHNFHEDVSFDDIINIYFFDRELRIIVLEAIDILEVAIRSVINNHMSNKYADPHWYMNQSLFMQTKAFSHNLLMRKIDKYTGKNSGNREIMFESYYSKYKDPEYPPCWMIAEAVPLGVWSMAYAYLAKKEDKKAISMQFGNLEPKIFQSWLHSITILRNLAAHHSRIWNRKFVVTPKIMDRPGIKEHLIPNDRIYAQLAVINYLLNQVNANNEWKYKLTNLLQKNQSLATSYMGFPANWSDDRFWGVSSFKAQTQMVSELA